MDIRHLLDFDFATSALGTLRIGSIKSYSVKEIRAQAAAPDVDARKLSLDIFIDAAHRLTGDDAIDQLCSGPAITSEEAAELTDEELHRFAEQYGARFFGENDGRGPTADEPKGADFLVFKINESKRLEQERRTKILDQAKKAYDVGNPYDIRNAIGSIKSSSQYVALQKMFDERRRWEEMRKIVEPYESIRTALGDISSWRKTLDELSKPKLISDQLRSYIDDPLGVSNILNKIHETSGWLGSLQHARDMYAESSIVNSIKEAQRAYQNISKQWELPNHLVSSVGALAALQEKIGRLTLPVIEWESAVALAQQLGPHGLQAELAALGINESGELIDAGLDSSDAGLLGNNTHRDLLTLLSIVLTLLIFIYQEQSSAQWQSSVNDNFSTQKVMLERQQKQLESLSILVEKAIAKEAALVNTRFVVLDRATTVRTRPQSGASVESKLLPREVVTLISERGKWIEVRYYHWLLKEYRTGWVLKKYLTRVPASQQLSS